MIKVRSLIHSVVLHQSSLVSLERKLGVEPGEITLDQLANRLGVAVETISSDEALWSAWRREGVEVVRRRCMRNLSATVQVGLRQLYMAGDLDADSYDEISKACSVLCKEIG